MRNYRARVTSAEKVVAVQLGKEKVTRRPYNNLPVSKGAYKEAGEGLFDRHCSDCTRSNGCRQGKLRLATGKKFFAARVVRNWHRLPSDFLGAPALAVFKATLNKALSKLV